MDMRLASVLLLGAGTLASVLLTPDSAAAWGRRHRCSAAPACCPVAPSACCGAPGYYAPQGYYAQPGYYAPPTAGQPMPGYQPPAPLPAAQGPAATATVN